MSAWRGGSLALLALALSGCGTAQVPTEPPDVGPVMAGPPAKGYEAVGIASWYGAKHHGRATASGAAFNKNALTAAHKSLAFGTKVEVTNLATKKSVVLTITDRGPYVAGRIIDVSERAAQTLGFRDAGIARVRVRALPQPIG